MVAGMAEKPVFFRDDPEKESRMKDNEDISVDELVSGMEEQLDDIYEKSQAQEAQTEMNAQELGAWLDELPEVKVPKEEKTTNERPNRGAQKASRSRSRRRK